jgi:hypothetical protein
MPLLTALLVAGCGLRRDRVVGVEGPPAITGVVQRGGASVPGEWVKLYDDQSGALADSSLTNSSGGYSIPAPGAGPWMVKVSSDLPGDLGYVRFLFTTSGGSDAVQVPPLDLAAHGFAIAQPTDSAAVAQPNIIAPLHFSWSEYQGTYKWASARVTDSLGVVVWASAQGKGVSADWNGVGNSDPPYLGNLVPPGRYFWRVKLHLPNSVQAASRQRQFVIGASL